MKACCFALLNLLLLRNASPGTFVYFLLLFYFPRCGNVAAILELDEHLQKEFIIFEAAPQETRGLPSKKPVADYFL